ncbi:MAG: hypothetical protein K6T86_07540, partial [Pirellulales bacterium]|nr:hypothetical protein [Pirellulales bacterium]
RQVPALGASRFKPVLEASPPDGRVLPTASVNAVRIWNRLMRAARWEAGCLACIAQDDARKELLEVDQLLQTCELSPRGSSQLTRAVRGKAARAGVKLARLYAAVPRSARKLLDQATPDADRAAELWFFLADDRQAENLEREVVARHPVTHPPELPLPREFRLELARDLLMASGLEADDRLIRGRPVQFHETALAWRLISRGGRARAGDLLQFRVQFDPESFEISHQGQTLASQQPRVWPGTAEQPVPLTLQITPRFSPGQSGSIALEALLNGEQVARTVHRIEIPPRRPPRLVVQGGAGSQPAEVMLHSQQLSAPGYVLELYPFASGETEFALFLDPNGADQQLAYRLVLLPPARISEFRPEHWVWQASDAELGLSQPHVGPLAIELQAADGPYPLRFWPAPPPVPDGAPPAAPAEPQPRQIGGLLALFYDKLWQDEVRVWIRFDPHPGRYLNDPDVQFDAPSARNLLRVEARLRDHALLEQRDAAAKQIVVELLCDDPRARREDVVKQLKDAIGPNRPAAVLQLALGWLSSNTEETPLFLSVDGYPRAYAYRVQRRAGPFQKLREDFRDVRLLEVGPPAAFAAPAGSPSPDAGPAPQPASLALEMPNGQSYLPQYFKNTNLQVRVLADAPPDDFRSGRLRLQVGLAPGWADAEPASPQYFFADRRVQISLLPKTPERLRVAVTVDDLLVTLDHTAFRNGRASIVARLVARDGTPQISKWAPVTFDEQAPSGREIQVTLRAEEVRRGRDVRIAAVDVADISGRAAWWAGIDKNGNGILDPDEEQEGGQDGTLNLATGELPNRNASYNVLVRVRDGAGNETPRDNCGAARFRLMRASEK